MDPLTVLREYVRSDQFSQVVEASDRIQFGDRYSFPRATLTAYKSQQGKGDLYALGTLVFYLKHRSAKFTDYLRACRDVGLQNINFVDRKDLEAYLTGASDTSDFIQLAPQALAAAADVDGEAPAAKRTRVEPQEDGAVPPAAKPLDGTAALASTRPQATERALCDRNTQLLIPGKDFTRVLELLAAAQRKKPSAPPDAAPAPRPHSASKQPHGTGKPPQPRSTEKMASQVLTGAAAGQAPALVVPSKRHERQAGTDLKAMGMEGYENLNIAVHGQRSAAPAAGVPPPPPTDAAPPPPPPGGPVPRAVEARASAAAPTVAASVPPQPKAPPLQVLSRPASRDHRTPDKDRQRHDGGGAPQHRSNHRRGGVPLIIVPSAATAKVNMWNAKALLEEGRYLAPEVARAAGSKKAPSERFQRTIGRKAPVAYEVADRVPELGSRDWQRVVAVFVTGAAWQFKGWPFKGAEEGDTVETLARVAGFYVGFQGEAVPGNVRAWNVARFELPKGHRHRDRPVVQDIYAALDAFLAARHSGLAY